MVTFNPQSPSLILLLFLSLMGSELHALPSSPTQFPTVHLSLSSCPCPQMFWSICVLAYLISHKDILCIIPSPKTTCSIGAQCYLLQTQQTAFNRQTPGPSPSSCFLNLKWRHLETSLTRWLTGSWFLELLRGYSREPFQLG